MSDDEVQHQARSFGGVADAYDRGRPGYPAEAAAWLTGSEPLSVLELGAGTGKLTAQLVALGHDVHATDPDQAMLDILAANLPDVRTSVGGAEEIPAPDSSYDVVVGAQCFHWFDHARALPEIVRVLKPRGRLSLVWNLRDERIPWVKKLGRIIGTQEQLVDPTEVLSDSMKFIIIESETFTHWQAVDRRSIQDLVASRSNIAVLDDAARAAKMQELLEFYDGYGRGMDGMQLPYVTRCFRTTVAARPGDDGPSADDAEDDAGPSDGTDTDMLLIDFR
jgi:ubiquinone/menaquinone biosynthesis C-methylase UbiE